MLNRILSELIIIVILLLYYYCYYIAFKNHKHDIDSHI